MLKKRWGQLSLLVAHWFSVPGDHGSNPDGDKCFLNCDPMIAVYLKINSRLCKVLIYELIHHFWLSLRLNNLKAGHKTN